MDLSTINTHDLLAELALRVGIYQTGPVPPELARPALDAVAEVMAVDMADLLRAGSRRQESVVPRMVAMAVLEETSHRTLAEIGALWKMDHASVIHARTRVRSMLTGNPAFAARLAAVMSLIDGDAHCRTTPRVRRGFTPQAAH